MGMNGNNQCCCSDVKATVGRNHIHCCVDRTASYVIGRKINSLYQTDVLKDKTKYKICRGLSRKLKDYQCPRERHKEKKRKAIGTRRSLRVQNIDAQPLFLYNMKKLHVKYDIFYDTITMEEKNIDQDNIDDNILVKQYENRDTLIANKIVENKKSYKREYKLLSYGE